MSFIQRNPFGSFLLLAYAVSWSFSVPLALSTRGILSFHVPHGVEMFAAFGPFVAALIVAKACDGSAGVAAVFRGFTEWRVPPVWFVFSALGPFILLAVVVGGLWLTSGAPDFATEKNLHYLTALGLFELIVVGGLVQGVGEEPGWRGFAIPYLRKLRGPILASLILFPFWMMWHLPQFLSRPDFGVAQFAGFALGILSATMWLTLIYDKTRSMLMAVIWHTVVNIARNLALAISTPMFLSFNMLITLGALIIVGYWIVTRKQQGPLG